MYGRDRLKSAHSDPTQDTEARRVGRRATGFKADPTMDRLVQMRDSDPEEFERTMNPKLRVALGLYERQKEAAEGGSA